MVLLWQKFVKVDYKVHILFSLILRLLLITYGVYHDQFSSVPYTDIDYKVFTDASRHILNGNSPYERHTFRYSPLIALFLIPNLVLHHTFGKILFSLFDIIVAVLIRIIVKNTLKEYDCYKLKIEGKNSTTYHPSEKQKSLTYKQRKKSRHSNKNINVSKSQMYSKNESLYKSDISMMAWLYNPLTIAIGTRGNCDSFAGFLVLLTIYFIQCRKMYFTAGLVHGISIHFRLYPLAYSLTFFMFLSKFSFYTTEDRRNRKSLTEDSNIKHIKNIENSINQKSGNNTVVPFQQNERKTIFKKEYLYYLIPNFDQIKLISGCFLTLFGLIGLFYHFYGYTFLYETYIFHLVRKDTRHNFSLYFYLQYLTAWVKNIGIWQKVLMVLPQIVLLLVFSVRYGLNKFSLNFSILVQTVVMVIYNTVLTSQYFVWVMAILPLCLWQIKMSAKTAIFLLTIWFAAQGAWLLPAYFLEFHGQNTFLYIWIQSVSLFCANIAILGRLIMYFMPVHEKSV